MFPHILKVFNFTFYFLLLLILIGFFYWLKGRKCPNCKKFSLRKVNESVSTFDNISFFECKNCKSHYKYIETSKLAANFKLSERVDPVNNEFTHKLIESPDKEWNIFNK